MREEEVVLPEIFKCVPVPVANTSAEVEATPEILIFVPVAFEKVTPPKAERPETLSEVKVALVNDAFPNEVSLNLLEEFTCKFMKSPLKRDGFAARMVPLADPF